MTTPLSIRDLEQLSAYLDNRLAPQERAELERRLTVEAALQTELAELRSTVRALRSLPTLKVPRHYTLSPALVGRPRPKAWIFPTLQLATVVATVLFAFVVSADLLNLLPVPGRAAAPAAVSALPEAAQTEPTAAAALPEAGGATEITQAESPGATEAPAAMPDESTEEVTLMVATEPDATAAAKMAATSTEDAPRLRSTAEGPIEAATIVADAAPEGTEMAAVAGEAESSSGEQEAERYAIAPEQGSDESVAPSGSPLLALEIGLGALVVLFGAATALAWRRRR